MATATITNGFTQLHACDATTGVSGNAIAVDSAVYKENSASLSFTLTASKKTIDVTSFVGTASWAAGDCVRFWFNFALPSELAVAASGGIKVELSDGSNTAFYQFLGSDNYGGGWVLGCVDIATGTILSGTRPTGTLTSIGIELTVTGTLRNATNTWLDNVHIGSGYSVYGGTDGDEIGMAEILAADISGGWGLVQETGGVYFINGKLNIGDDASTNATYFLDSGKPLSFTHIGTVPSDVFKLSITGNTTGVTDVDISGFFVQGDTENVDIDFLDSNLDDLRVFGTTFKSTNDILFTSDTTHTISNCVFDTCGQIIPLLATFTNNTIVNYVGTSGAVKFPSDSTNIYNLTFINCDNGVLYDSVSDATPTFVNFTFDDVSGNYDVNSTDGAITIVLSGGNANSYNTSGGTVTFSNPVILTLAINNDNSEVTIMQRGTEVDTGLDGGSTAGSRDFVTTNAWTVDAYQGHLLEIRSGSDTGRYYVTGNSATTLYLDAELSATASSLEWDLYDENDDTELFHVENSSGDEEYNYSSGSGSDVDILVFHLNYQDYVLENYTLLSSNATIPISQIADVNYYNP